MNEFEQAEAEMHGQQDFPEEHKRVPGDNTIYVGRKHVMAYAIAVVTQFNQGAGNVHLKARGKAISKAIDVTQIVKNKFLPSVEISEFKASTEQLLSEDGRQTNVSSLDLMLKK